MKKPLQPNKKLVPDFVYGQRQLPTDRPIVQYIRQSTDTQVKNNRQSAVMQDQRLAARLIKMGWTDDLIIKIDIDQGKSGMKRRDQRKGLDYLYTLIETGKAGAIAAYDVSRLYRDLDRVHYTEFVHMCERFNIPVVTFSRIYWPDVRADTDALIADFAAAAKFIDEVIIGKLLAAKLDTVENNASYAGHCVPMGYIIVEVDDRKQYAIYEPHAFIVRWLFARYRAPGGNLGKLCREVLETGLIFPPFANVEKIPHVALRWNGAGYPIQTRSGIISILTNVAYIGRYTFDGVLVSKDSHPPIVNMDDFLYAYSRLSAYTLDGEPNEDRPRQDKRRDKSCDALLENILACGNLPVYVMRHTGTYMAKLQEKGSVTSELAVRVADLDKEFSMALRQALAEMGKRHEQGIADSLHDQLIDALKETARIGNTLDEQLASVARAIRQEEMNKRVALQEEYEEGVRDAVKQLKRLHTTRQELEEKRDNASREAAELAETHSLIDVAVHRWDSLPFAMKQRFVRLMVASAHMEAASPHYVRITVTFGAPFHKTLTGFLYRARGSKAEWEPEEDAALRLLYPSADRLALLHALPARSWLAIAHRAGILQLSRARRLNTSDIDENLCYADVLIRQEQGIIRDGSPVPGDTCPTSCWRISDTIQSCGNNERLS